MILNHILFQFLIFSSQADNDNWHEGGSVAGFIWYLICRWEGGGGVGHISVKIKLTAFCMHLTLFNQVQVDVHVDFVTFHLIVGKT